MATTIMQGTLSHNEHNDYMLLSINDFRFYHYY